MTPQHNGPMKSKAKIKASLEVGFELDCLSNRQTEADIAIVMNQHRENRKPKSELRKSRP